VSFNIIYSIYITCIIWKYIQTWANDQLRIPPTFRGFDYSRIHFCIQKNFIRRFPLIICGFSYTMLQINNFLTITVLPVCLLSAIGIRMTFPKRKIREKTRETCTQVWLSSNKYFGTYRRSWIRKIRLYSESFACSNCIFAKCDGAITWRIDDSKKLKLVIMKDVPPSN
jgi:hypothetical protein